MSDQIHAAFDQEVESSSCRVSAAIVSMEQRASGSTVWAVLVPLLEDLWQAVVDEEHSELTIFLSSRGKVAARLGLEKEHATIYFCITLQ